MPTVPFAGTREELAAFLRRLPRILAGEESDRYGIAERMQRRLGNALLKQIQRDFRTKALGYIGEDGIRWPPLKPATIAKKRGRWGNLILREEGDLLRSFTPGEGDQPSGVAGQVFEVEPGVVRVGTTEKPWHHRGIQGKLPARPFWPLDGSIPAAWWRHLMRAYRRGLAQIVADLVKSGRVI